MIGPGGLKVDQGRLDALSEADRAIVVEQLAAVEAAFRENPLLGYRPHKRQVEFHSLPAPKTRLFLGGNRSGKTTATMLDSIIQAVDRDVVPEHLRSFKVWDPPFHGRVIGPDLTRWLEGVALEKFREWCPKNQLVGGGFQRGWDKQQLMLRFKNGSWIQFMSNDQELDKFAGAALHRVVYDESPREDIRSECLMRLIDFDGEELFGLTPTEGMSNWLFAEFYEPWEEGHLDEQDARLVLVDMDDNPHLSEEGKKRALQGLSEQEREARKTGRFVTFEGKIFPMFNRRRHIVPDEDEIPRDVECFEGIDPGMRNAAVVFCYLTTGDDLVVYDELLIPNRTVAEVVKALKMCRARWEKQPRWTVIDPAAKNRNGQTGRSDQAEYLDHGIVTFPGQNDWRPGVNRVMERLEADRLHISARCQELRREFEKYRFAKPPPRSEHQAPERPVKRDDHLLDALRYVCMQRPLAPRESIVPENRTFKDRALRAALKRLGAPARPDSGFGPGVFQ